MVVHSLLLAEVHHDGIQVDGVCTGNKPPAPTVPKAIQLAISQSVCVTDPGSDLRREMIADRIPFAFKSLWPPWSGSMLVYYYWFKPWEQTSVNFQPKYDVLHERKWISACHLSNNVAVNKCVSGIFCEMERRWARFRVCIDGSTHWDRNKMVASLQTKMFEFWLKFHRNLFLRIQLTTRQQVLVMAWCQTGAKPLSEPMLT